MNLHTNRWVVVPVTVADAGGTLYMVERLLSREKAMQTPTHSRQIAEQEARRLNAKDFNQAKAAAKGKR